MLRSLRVTLSQQHTKQPMHESRQQLIEVRNL